MDVPSRVSARKPRALFLSAEAPYPVIGGGPLRSASLLEYLAQRFSVHVILFRQPGDPDATAAFPAGIADRVDVLSLPYHSKHPATRVLRNSVRYARNRPPLMDRFSGFAEAIAKLLAGNEYDAAMIEHFWCAPYVEQVRPHSRRVILDLHNIESVWHESVAAAESPARSLALRRFAKASLEMERKLFPAFDALLAASEQDARAVHEIAPGLNVTVYPNALPEIAQPPLQDREQIVFSGNLEYPPNIGAVRFFKRHIWPELAAQWPALTWILLGKNPEAIREIIRDDDRIETTGFVTDAITVLAAARVAVVPLLAGSGTRIKILEAWAAGIPVVSTTLGAEGLEARDGEHLLIADDPGEFTRAVSHLLASPADRARIASAARRLYEQRYTWPAAWRTLNTVFDAKS